MFHAVSWTAFIKALLLLILVYYTLIALLFFRTECRAILRRVGKRVPILLPSLLAAGGLRAQTADGNNGLSQANTMVRSYFDTGTQLMYAAGAIVGLIGAFRVFSLWQSGHREDMNRAAAAWFGSCIFLVIVATVIKSFFGL